MPRTQSPSGSLVSILVFQKEHLALPASALAAAHSSGVQPFSGSWLMHILKGAQGQDKLLAFLSSPSLSLCPSLLSLPLLLSKGQTRLMPNSQSHHAKVPPAGSSHPKYITQACGLIFQQPLASLMVLGNELGFHPTPSVLWPRTPHPPLSRPGSMGRVEVGDRTPEPLLPCSLAFLAAISSSFT